MNPWFSGWRFNHKENIRHHPIPSMVFILSCHLPFIPIYIINADFKMDGQSPHPKISRHLSQESLLEHLHNLFSKTITQLIITLRLAVVKSNLLNSCRSPRSTSNNSPLSLHTVEKGSAFSLPCSIIAITLCFYLNLNHDLPYSAVTQACVCLHKLPGL